MANYGISTLGVTVSYAQETTAGTRPTTGYTALTRINSIGEISLDQESIDASALEDMLTKNIAGRGTVSDTMSVTVNLTPETQAEWETLISAAATAKATKPLPNGKLLLQQIPHLPKVKELGFRLRTPT